jgi:hypothetical protein
VKLTSTIKRRAKIKHISLSKPLLLLVILLMATQVACGVGSIAATVMAPTAAPNTDSIQAMSTSEATQVSPTASPGEHATAAMAEAMLKAAVQYYKTAGRDQALQDFTDKKPPFANGDLYVVCLGSDHKITANGGFPMLVGLSADSIKDPNGKPLGQDVWDLASMAPQGAIPIHWDNPLTNQPESKILYYQKLDQDVCGVAADNTQ